jgi:ribulose-5-phosphate 4-epimerase/fuculose-1-phosphate aldolase
MHLRNLLCLTLAGALLVGVSSDLARSATPSPFLQPMAGPAIPATDEERIAELVIANHILADQGVVDGFGHISVRAASNPKHYFMSSSVSPALVTRADIVELDENSAPIDARGREMYGERFIHGEIFRARPDVQSVAHSHSTEVLPYTLTKTPLKALIHVAGFLGDKPVPVYDLRQTEGPKNLMLVKTTQAGADLAKALGSRSVVLLRGHGMAVAAPTTRDAVMRAIYTRVNAQVQTEALKLGEPVFMNDFEVTRVDPISRQWPLWVRQAEAHGLK